MVVARAKTLVLIVFAARLQNVNNFMQDNAPKRIISPTFSVAKREFKNKN